MTPDERRAARRVLLQLLVRLGLAVLALGLVTYGAWCIYPPAGYIVAGGLIWLELARSSRRPPREEG